MSRKALWTGRIVAGIGALFLLADSLAKILRAAPTVEGTRSLGYPEWIVAPLGYVQLACLILYLIPRTSTLGAILLTGYLGGAVATHARLVHPLFTHVLFPTYVAAFLWGGLFLLDGRLRALLRPRTA